MADVAFYYSIGSRYSYLASSQLAELVGETGCQIDWLPLNSVRLELPATRKQLDQTMNSALRAGVFGVPAFVVDGELFWGNDRLVLLKRHLERLAQRT
jgi:2-hydroxychromene-2-carboxylate isomerase